MSQISLQVGVKIFLKNKDGKFLLIRRNTDKYKNAKGNWDIVGGRIEPGVSLIDNLKREVKEETQLEILSEPKLLYAQDIIPDTERHIVRLSYVGDTGGEPVLDISENTEYKWLSVEEIKKQSDLDIYVREIIDLGLLK